MAHKYYSEDTEQRKRYFDNQLLSNAKFLASQQGITVNQILSQISDFNSFKQVLEQVWSQDSSLLAYFEGMDDSELKEFFNRNVVQRIIQEKIPTFERIPDLTIQVQRKPRRLFSAKLKEKKTGITKRVFAKQEFVSVKGKRQQRYRDSKGRFVSIK